MNDSHGYLDLHNDHFWKNGEQIYREVGGYARIKQYFNIVRAQNPDSVIALDNGDTIHGTYPVVKSKGEVMIPILNELAFDAWTAHWDFAYGSKYLKNFSEKLNYPLLATNCYNEETGSLIFSPYKIINRNGIKIGIIGIAATIVDKTMPESFSEGIYFTTGEKELPHFIKELKKKMNIDIIIVFSHLGFPQDVKLLKQNEEIDVFISGHTHNRIYRPIKINKSIIIQSGSHGSFIGRLDLGIIEKKIKNVKHELVIIEKSITPDDHVQEIIDNIMRPQNKFLSKVIGITKIGLARDNVMETTMDNLLLKALIEISGAEIAFSNGWRYGVPIPPGQITMEDIWNIIPTNPPVSICEISGEDLWDMMEENLEHTFSRDPFNQMGGYVKRCHGINVYFKVENANGLRIQEFFIGNKKLDREKNYKATFVTTQGIPAKYGNNRRELNVYAIDALEKYIKKHSPVKPEIQGTFIPI